MTSRLVFRSNLTSSKYTQPNLFRCFSTAATNESLKIVGGDGKNRIVVLGTGWAGFNLVRKLKSNADNAPEVRVVSPSNHFVFTPLLPSTAVGTLEFRCIQVIKIIWLESCEYVFAQE